ncbi:hypothetical protein [Paraburkholderia sp. J41]|uniref:hypothetical protein n=1 Tax=Paraburkholderia sp. J41 TaxID=2805433 RepID=UPI002AC3232D|nr:hypothetical protein [Paraburkholderia sp. J41]
MTLVPEPLEAVQDRRALYACRCALQHWLRNEFDCAGGEEFMLNLSDAIDHALKYEHCGQQAWDLVVSEIKFRIELLEGYSLITGCTTLLTFVSGQRKRLASIGVLR